MTFSGRLQETNLRGYMTLEVDSVANSLYKNVAVYHFCGRCKLNGIENFVVQYYGTNFLILQPTLTVELRVFRKKR